MHVVYSLTKQIWISELCITGWKSVEFCCWLEVVQLVMELALLEPISAMVNLLIVLPVLPDLPLSVTTTVFAVAQPLEDDNEHPRGIVYSLKGAENCCLLLQLLVPCLESLT